MLTRLCEKKFARLINIYYRTEVYHVVSRDVFSKSNVERTTSPQIRAWDCSTLHSQAHCPNKNPIWIRASGSDRYLCTPMTLPTEGKGTCKSKGSLGGKGHACLGSQSYSKQKVEVGKWRRHSECTKVVV